MSADPFELDRFLGAQEPVYAQALGELRAGRKRSHWMWFVFPQHQALGRSAMAVRYGIRSLDEARAYLAHPVLGPRLHECCQALLDLPGQPTAHDILGSPDDLKLRSCLTLFLLAAAGDPLFEACLARYCGGQRDERTIALCAP
jgi:uncharacterized protein (DUF1810 family)